MPSVDLPSPSYTEPELKEQLMATAADEYTRLRFHNFKGHILGTIEAGIRIVDYLVGIDIHDVNPDRLVMALGHHDAGIHIPSAESGFEISEAFSAHRTVGKLGALGAKPELIYVIKNGIIATVPDAIPSDNFQTALRYSDVDNVTDEDFVRVLGNTHNVMYEEELQLHIRPADSYEEKRDRIVKFLGHCYFFNPKPFMRDGEPIMYPPALIGQDNLERLQRLSRKAFTQLVPEAEETFAQIWPEQKNF